MNRQILMGIISIFAVVGLVGGLAVAYFSDIGTSTDNVFASGTFNLKLGNSAPASSDNVSATWTGSGMAPGGTGITSTLYLRNSGTVPGDHVHFKATNTLTDNPDAEDLGPMARHLEITSLVYSGTPVSVPETNGNGYADLEDLQSVGDGITLGSLTDLNVDHALVMTVRLNSDVNDTYQGDSVSTVFTSTLHQNAGQ